MKKSLLVLTLVSLFIIIAIFTVNAVFKGGIKRIYLLWTIDFSQGTGAIHSTPEPILVNKSDEIENLNKQLPYSTENFIINRFDYKTAKFIVVFNDLDANNKKEIFLQWLNLSEFSSIPFKRFEIK